MSDKFYVLKYTPDGAGSPYFFETNWLPELPDFHYPTENPKKLNNQYEVNAKIDFVDADYLPDQFLASRKLITLCNQLAIDAVYRKVDLIGLRGKIKDYYFFAPTKRISLLDEGKSKFSRDVDKHTGRPATSLEEDGEFPVYEIIDRFVVSPLVCSHLFFCRELKELVCSETFRAKFVEARMKGISFEAIDNKFRYAPWEFF